MLLTEKTITDYRLLCTAHRVPCNSFFGLLSFIFCHYSFTTESTELQGVNHGSIPHHSFILGLLNCLFLYRVPSTEYRVPRTEYRIPNTEYQVPSTSSFGLWSFIFYLGSFALPLSRNCVASLLVCPEPFAQIPPC